jgi:hypothetical protein
MVHRMPAGQTQAAFAVAAAADGVDLVLAKIPGINQRGHVGLPQEAARAVPTLAAIFTALGGNQADLAAKRTTALQGDYLHVASGLYIEVDEIQHFTTARLATLDLYPAGTPLGYDIETYRKLCRLWSAKADKAFAHKADVAFGPRGRQRQRAYNDALRDVGLPALGHPPVVRIAIPDGDGPAAYRRNRDLLCELLRDPR